VKPPHITDFAAYVASLPAGVRGVAHDVRAAVLAAAPTAGEAIQYGMPAFLRAGVPFLYFAVWRRHVGVYPLYPDAGELEPLVAPYRAKKDTLQFSLREPLPYDVIRAVASFKLAIAQTQAAGR